MRATGTLIRREFNAYFLSPIAYVVMVVFLAVTGYLFYLTMQQLTAAGPQGIEFPMQLMIGGGTFLEGRMVNKSYLVGFLLFWLVFLVIPPLLTMRLFAEERSTGTLEMLMTAPVRDWQVVLSKYLACFAFFVVMLLPTLAYVPILIGIDWNSVRPLEWQTYAPRLDPWPVVTSYLGLLLAGGMFLSLGLLVSSLVRSQVAAFLVALFLSLAFIVVGLWQPEMESGSILHKLLVFFSVPVHFDRDFSRGLIDTRHIVLYVSVTLFSLFLTVRSLESRRWR